MKQTKTMRTVGVAALCAALGTAGGIASSGAASGDVQEGQFDLGRARPAAGGQAGTPSTRTRSSSTRPETAFINATEDSASVVSVSGDQLTIKEGTKSVTYKTLTLTIPSGATIKRNGSTAQLSALKAGDHVHVTKSSDGTTVFADDGTHRPMGPGHGPPGGGY